MSRKNYHHETRFGLDSRMAHRGLRFILQLDKDSKEARDKRIFELWLTCIWFGREYQEKLLLRSTKRRNAFLTRNEHL